MAGSGSDDGDKFLVRGALLKCSCSSHPRRLNLMKDHGVTVDLKDGYDKGHPFVHEMDCVSGPTGNIDYFGVCNMLPKNSPTAISLQAVNEKGELTGGVVQGGKCVPAFVPQKWSKTKEDVRIGGVNGKKMVTMESCLMCPLGGIITPVTTGMEYKGEQDG